MAYTPFVPTGEDAGAVVTEIGRLCGETKCGRILPGIDGIAFVSPINIPAGTRLRIVARNIGISVNVAGLAGGTLDESIGVFSSVVDGGVALGNSPKATDIMWGKCVTPAIAPPPPVTQAQDVPAGMPGRLAGPSLAPIGTSSALNSVNFETNPSTIAHTCEQGISITMGLKPPNMQHPTAPDQRLGGASVLLLFNCGSAAGGKILADGALTCPVSAAVAASAIAAQSNRRRLGSNEIVLSETADGVPARRLLTVDGSGRMYYRGRRLSGVQTVTTVTIQTHWCVCPRDRIQPFARLPFSICRIHLRVCKWLPRASSGPICLVLSCLVLSFLVFFRLDALSWVDAFSA
jgi:hypothetical protein